MNTPDWVRDAVFYQIFPDRFASSSRVAKPAPLEDWSAAPTTHGFKGGDLLGIVERLDYLEDLGVTAIYLNPIFRAASNHRYNAYDYLSVDPLLGGDAALGELLEACHGRGMRVVLDGVFNHVGRGFWAFHHVMETGASSPYGEWFHLDRRALEAGVPLRAYPTGQERADLVAAGTEIEHRESRLSLHHLGYRSWWDHPELPKLNVANPQVRDYILGVAEHWIRAGVDGWRLDVPEEIDDPRFWIEFRRRVKSLNPAAYLVGEIWREAPEWLTGDRFDAVMNYPLAEAILGFAGGSHLDLATVAEQDAFATTVQPLDGVGFSARVEHLLGAYDPAVVAVQLNLLGSHDTPRFVTMCGGDRTSLRLATLIQMTLPGAPCVYYGDEIGLEGHQDPDCRRAFPRDRSSWDTELHSFVRGAIALRRANPALRHGRYRTVVAEGQTIAFVRQDGEACYLVAVNAGETLDRVVAHLPEAAGRVMVAERWGGWPGEPAGQPVALAEDRLALEVPARGALVLRAM